ncbi:MAG TPA: hypothetical protein VHL08_08555 [Dongiaceae bacterium]|jgi:hypothetical protein|nr:hypothetical protein [Dongiaceae bacterium]
MRWLPIFLSLLLFWATMPQPVLAESTGIFTVPGITVEQDGEPLQAREKALVAGERPAWQKLMAQIAPSGNAPAPSDAELAAWVRDFDVESEKFTPNHYTARFTYRFAATPVRAFLDANRVVFVEQQTQPLLVIAPYTDTTGLTFLWEPRNIWAAAWHNAGQSIAPLMPPAGTLEDQQTLSASALTSSAALQRLAKAYNAVGAVVASAKLAGAPDQGGFRLDIVATLYSNGQPPQTFVTSIQPEQDLDLLMKKGVADIAVQIARQWKQENATDGGQTSAVTVHVLITDLVGWADLNRRLANVPSVTAERLLSFSRQEAVLTLSHRGTSDQFAQALANAGLSLTPAVSGEMILAINTSFHPSAGTPQPIAPQPSPSTPTP